MDSTWVTFALAAFTTWVIMHVSYLAGINTARREALDSIEAHLRDHPDTAGTWTDGMEQAYRIVYGQEESEG